MIIQDKYWFQCKDRRRVFILINLGLVLQTVLPTFNGQYIDTLTNLVSEW